MTEISSAEIIWIQAVMFLQFGKNLTAVLQTIRQLNILETEETNIAKIWSQKAVIRIFFYPEQN